MSYLEEKLADQRLIILRALHEENDGSLSEVMVQKCLDAYAHRMNREDVKELIVGLEKSGAVKVFEVSDYAIATLTDAGVDHLDRRKWIDGIARPSYGSK